MSADVSADVPGVQPSLPLLRYFSVQEKENSHPNIMGVLTREFSGKMTLGEMNRQRRRGQEGSIYQ